MADQIAEGLRFYDLLLQVSVLKLQLRFEMLDFLKGPRVGDGCSDMVREDSATRARLSPEYLGTKAHESSQDLSLKHYGAENGT